MTKKEALEKFDFPKRSCYHCHLKTPEGKACVHCGKSQTPPEKVKTATVH